MGNCLSSSDSDEFNRSKEIDLNQRKFREKDKKEMKILLLGPGESGKSTVFKQMQLLYAEGFSYEIRISFTQVIRRNILEWMQSLIKAARRFHIPFKDQEEKDAADYVLNRDLFVSSEELDQLSEKLFFLWGESLENGGSTAIKKTYWNRFKLYFDVGDSGDSLIYFFEKIRQIFSDNYVPDDQDILRARLKTTSIIETIFYIDRSPFKFIDIGGQRNERRKWIHCFNGVTAILFIVAISAYDQTLFEDPSVNRMHDALAVWDTIVNNPTFRNTPFILFFNKFDLFQEKIKTVDLRICFPEFAGPSKEVGVASEFIMEKFLSLAPEQKQSDLYCYYTTATDTDNIEKVWETSRKLIIKKALNDTGLGGDFL